LGRQSGQILRAATMRLPRAQLSMRPCAPCLPLPTSNSGQIVQGQEGQASIDLPLGGQLETHSPVAWFAADYLIARRILHDRPSP
jgi:hypothetical protein